MRFLNSGFVNPFGGSLLSRQIPIAINVSSAMMMMTDPELVITYVNPSLMRTLRAAESDLRKDLLSFSADTLVGTSIDQFHKNASHQRGMLKQLNRVHRAEIRVGGRYYALTITPLDDGRGHREGFLTEWLDNTEKRMTE